MTSSSRPHPNRLLSIPVIAIAAFVGFCATTALTVPAYAQHESGGAGQGGGQQGGSDGGHADGSHDDGSHENGTHDDGSHEDGGDHEDGHDEGGGRGPQYRGGFDQMGHMSGGHGGFSLEDRVFRVGGFPDADDGHHDSESSPTE